MKYVRRLELSFRLLLPVLLSTFIVVASLSAQSVDAGSKRPLILLEEFRPFQSVAEKEVAEAMSMALTRTLNRAGYRIVPTLTDATATTQQRIDRARRRNAFLLVDGYYHRAKKGENLNLYAQIYNPRTGYMIDAFNVSDDIYQLRGIVLDKEEMREGDGIRINRLAAKIADLIRVNPRLRENRNNINEYAVYSRVGRTHAFPVTTGSRAARNEVKRVLDLFRIRRTTAATKVSRPVTEVPGSVNVITREEMIRYGDESINDVLFRLPGFSPSQDYDRRTVSARGMFEGWNNNHLLMLMDGVQFNDSLYGSAYTWEITPLNMIKSLEVLRGPGSALYGSYATNGVISINTLSGEDLNGKIDLRVRAGDFGTRYLDFVTGNTGSLFSWVLSVSSRETDGNNYDDYDFSGRTLPGGVLARFPVRDNRTSRYGFAKLEGRNGLKGLSIQFHLQDWSFQTGHGWIWRIPDFGESMSESRSIVAVKYTDQTTRAFKQEYVLRYQKHSINWNMRYAENGAFNGFYPAGIWEYLKTEADEWFVRGQWSYAFGGGASVLGGVEGTHFLYTGDDEHHSNIDLSNSAGGFPPNLNNATLPQGAWLEWIENRPVLKGGAFAQLVSGKIWRESTEFTVGVRHDQARAKYRGIDQPFQATLGRPSLSFQDPANPSAITTIPLDARFLGPPFVPEEVQSFNSTSPRVGVVFFPRRNLVFKAMAGKAFREPAVTESYGANTFTLASNVRNLKPEFIRTSELAADWTFAQGLRLRSTYFRTKFENWIAYSTTGNNLSTNIYSLTTQGLETELHLNYGRISGFLNVSFNDRIQEHTTDGGTANAGDELTWAPAVTGNLGLAFVSDRFTASLIVFHQGPVQRRTSDFGPLDEATLYQAGNIAGDPNRQALYRPRVVPAWTSVNTRIAYRPVPELTLGIRISNLFNSEQLLIKNNLYAFDYRRMGRRFQFDIRAVF